MQPEPDRCIDGGSQAGRLVNVGPSRGESEDVGRDLHRHVALRPATRHPELFYLHSGPPLGSFLALPQRVGQPLQDRTVDVGPRVDIAEPDDGPFRLRPRHLDTRRPVRLQDEPHRPGRDVADKLVEQGLRLDALLVGDGLLPLAELLLEPGHHPVTPEDLNLEAVEARYRCRVGGNLRHRFDILAVCGVDRGGRAVTQTPDRGRDAPGPDHLAGLVRRRGN